jgi:transcriptional regulator with XRE-family HTH domain
MAHQNRRSAGPSEGSRLLLIEMEARGWRIVDLAQRLGVDETAVGRWLRGKRLPNAQSAAQIENVVGVPARTWGIAPFVTARPGTAA